MSQIEDKYKQKFRINSNRFKGFDYSSNSGYFITICTKDKINYFGEIIEGKMVLNELGIIVKNEINVTEKIRENVIIDEFVIMPNHLHIIIIINNKKYEQCSIVETPIYRVSNIGNNDITNNQDTINGCLYNKGGNLLKDKNIMLNKNSLGFIVRQLKGKITYMINKSESNPYFAWQPNYYDRIIRNDFELEKIRKYIVENPLKWEIDKNNDENIFI